MKQMISAKTVDLFWKACTFFIICSKFTFCGAIKEVETSTWYVGCYVRKDGDTNIDTVVPLTPSTCSKWCSQAGYAYAGVSGTSDCRCLKDIENIETAKETECSARCTADPYLPCGNTSRYSIFSTQGPFIDLVRVEISPRTAVADKPANITVNIRLASQANMSTGLSVYDQINFAYVDVVLDPDGRSPRPYTVAIKNARGFLRVQHFYRNKRVYLMNATASNAISSETMTRYVEVKWPQPRNLAIKMTSPGRVAPTCTSKAFRSAVQSNSNKRRPNIVMIGSAVILEASLTDGFNLNFEWNICHMEIRQTKPYLRPQCQGNTCTADEQTFRFNRSGVCEVTVRASNELGSASASLSMTVLAPVIDNLKVTREFCSGQTTCPLQLPPDANIFRAIMYDFSDRSTTSNATFGPGILHSFSPTNAPLHLRTSTRGSPDPAQVTSFRRGTYQAGERVCFHATARVTAADAAKINVRFSDGKTMSHKLYDPYLRFLRASPQVKFNFTFCYKNDCTLHMYFEHVYQKPGYYNIDVQLSNSSSQPSARLDRSFRIVGNNLKESTLQCTSVVKTHHLASMSVRGGHGLLFTWIIDKRDDSNENAWKGDLQSSAHWTRSRRIPHTSPLRHRFTEHGIYAIYVSDTQTHLADDEVCIILVEESVEDVTMVIHPELRYVAMGVPVKATLKVGKGSNFTVTWYVSNQVRSNSKRHNAPYSSTISITPSTVGCQTISAVVQNTVSRSEERLSKIICSEEILSELQMDVSSFLTIGESTEMVVKLTSGSHAEITIDIRDACSTETQLMSFSNNTGAQTGKKVLKFTTLPFLSPGLFEVVATANNHVSTCIRSSAMRKYLQVGNIIYRVSAVRLNNASSTKIFVNRENHLVALVNGLVDNTSDVLYQWEFFNEQGQRSVKLSASPVVRIEPHCFPLTASDFDCTLNLTVRSGRSKATVITTLTPPENVSLRAPLTLQHPFAVEVKSKLTINATCLNALEISGCKVMIGADNVFVGMVTRNSTASFHHLFLTPGLWQITKESIRNGLVASSAISYVSVQEKISGIRLQGDSVLTIDEKPSGTWQAYVDSGSHLVFQWKLKRKNSTNTLIALTKSSCKSNFEHLFKDFGFYEVLVDVFNDVSHVTTTTNVEVRQASFHVTVQVPHVHLGEMSNFSISVRLNRPFMLAVRWREGGSFERFSRDQLHVIDGYPSRTGITTYTLTHMYETSGEHCYNVTMKWSAAGNTVGQSAIGHAVVYDRKVLPPPVAVFRLRDRERLHAPYYVIVGEVLTFEVNVSREVELLTWVVQKGNRVVDNKTIEMSATKESYQIYRFSLNSSTTGTYLCKIGSNVASIPTILRIKAYRPVTHLSLGRPKQLRSNRYVQACQLVKQNRSPGLESSDYACYPVRFSAECFGGNVTFIFNIHLMADTERNNRTGVLIRKVGNIVPELSDPTQRKVVASVDHVFEREGGYNISVMIFPVEDGNQFDVSAPQIASLDYLFYAEALPKVRFDQALYVAMPRQPIRFVLVQTKADQQLTIRWVMGDGKVYPDAGLVNNRHSYQAPGYYRVTATATNKIGRTIVVAEVTVQERIKRVNVSVEKAVCPTKALILFTAAVDPPGSAVTFTWHFGNNSHPDISYHWARIHKSFPEPERVTVWVLANNSINEQKSNEISITVVDRIEVVTINCDGVVDVGMPLRLESTHDSKSPVQYRWNFGDGAEIYGNSSVSHVFNRSGSYFVNLKVWNEVSTAMATQQVFVMKKKCPWPSVKISGTPSRKIYRSEPLPLEATVDFNCSQVERVAYLWRVKKIDLRGQLGSTLLTGNSQMFYIGPRNLSYGRFEISVNISFVGTLLFASSTVQVSVEGSRVVARIDGGLTGMAARNETVVINASSSYDPDFQMSQLTFIWACYVLHSQERPCFPEHDAVGQGGSSYRTLWGIDPPQKSSTFGASVYRRFPRGVLSNQSVLFIPTNMLDKSAATFIFKVTVASGQRQESNNNATYVLKLTGDASVARIQLDCPSCRQSSANRQHDVLLTGLCSNCHGGRVQYKWKLSVVEQDDSEHTRKNETASCVPPDGSGWIQRWETNATGTANLTLNDTRGSSSFFSFNLNHTFTQRGVVQHPDNSNFSGILPQVNGVRSFSNGPRRSRLQSVDSSRTYYSIPTRGSQEPSSMTWEDLAKENQSGKDDVYSAYDDETSLDGDTSGIQWWNGTETSSRLAGAPTGNLHQPSRGQLAEHSHSGSRVSEFETRIGDRNSNRRISNVSETELRGWLPTSQNADFLRNDAFSAHLPPEIHYQDHFHKDLYLHRVAVVRNLTTNNTDGSNRQVLLIRRNSLREGRTYAVSVEIVHFSDEGQVLKKGSASYYLRVNNGPSYGECSVSSNGNNIFSVYCFQWKNRQSKRLDTDVSLNEGLNYNISYTLSDGRESRALYFGAHYDRTFSLPSSNKPVYVHVTLFNHEGAETEVCSFPADTSTNQTKLAESPMSKINFVYDKSVGNSSQLQHAVLQRDDYAILAHVNVMLDSLPSESELQSLTAADPVVNGTVRRITVELIESLSQINRLHLRSYRDLLTTLARILNLRDYAGRRSLLAAAELMSKSLTKSRQIFNEDATECCQIDQLRRLGKEVTYHGIGASIIEASLTALGSITSAKDSPAQLPHSASEKMRRSAFDDDTRFSRNIEAVEKAMRDLFFDTNKEQAILLGPRAIARTGIGLKIQSADMRLNVGDGVRFGEAVFPASSLPTHGGSPLLQTVVAYTRDSPYKSKPFNPQVSRSAISLWLMNDQREDVRVKDLEEPIIIYLPPRPTKEKMENYSYVVEYEKMSQHFLNLTAGRKRNLHIHVKIDPKARRRFPIFVAVSDRPLNKKNPLNDSHIIANATIQRQTPTLHPGPENFRFTLGHSESISTDTIYVTLLNKNILQSERRTQEDVAIAYRIDAWWSDCYYWNPGKMAWDTYGCNTSSESTLSQTVCATNHLSTYGSSFRKLTPVLVLRNIVSIASASALSSCLTVMLLVWGVFCAFLLIHRYILRKREPSSDMDDTVAGPRPRIIVTWLRWMFGTDDRGASGRVPIILRDNRPEHRQVFEVTIQTGSWPGSGTSSLPHLLLYGLEGKYEARQLEPADKDNLHLTTRDANGNCLFETGSIKTFIVTFEKSLGPLWKTCVWHDHTGARPRWFLDYVIIRDVTSGGWYHFPCHSWLALDRGCNRISRNLMPMESKPQFARQVAIRARNYLLDYHSVVSIFACARWAVLTRAQRIVHIMTLCTVIFALATVKSILFESRKYGRGVSTFSWENLSWGVIMGIGASVSLIPAQMILRYTKRDEQISVVIEDNTSRTSNSRLTDLSRVSLPNSNGEQTRSKQGTLRKTATVIHNFEELDQMMSANDAVVDWLQCKELVRNGCDNEINGYREESGPSCLPGSVGSLGSLPDVCPSVNSYEEEIARCMSPGVDSAISTNLPQQKKTGLKHNGKIQGVERKPDSCYEESEVSFAYNTVDEIAVVESKSSTLQKATERREHAIDQQSILAMDGPELVPCEKLEPMPKMRSGYLPRACSWVGWAYYALTGVISAFCAIYGVAKYLGDTDFDVWMETWCFALFWTVVAVEVIVVLVMSVLASVWDVVTKRSLHTTLEELFPTVDSAPVDDYAYKDYKYMIADETATQTGETVVSPSEINKRISDRRRLRFLRNLTSPYHTDGTWKAGTNHLHQLAQRLRKQASAKKALHTWLALLSLALLLIVVVVTQTSGNRARIRHVEHVKLWFRRGFCVRNGFQVSTSCPHQHRPPFLNISNFEDWQSWFDASFYIMRETRSVYGNTNLTQSGSFLLLSAVRVTGLNLLSPRRCSSVPAKMRQIMNISNCSDLPENTLRVVNPLHNRSPDAFAIGNVFHLNLLQPNKHQYLNLSNRDGLMTELIAYNWATRHYVTLTAISTFRRQGLAGTATVRVRSVLLHHKSKPIRDALTLSHVILVFWVTWCASKCFIACVERVATTREHRKELRKSSLLPYAKGLVVADVAMWLTVVIYLVAATMQRRNLLASARYIENTGHLEKDYADYLQKVIDNEAQTHYLLGAWTVLVVIKGVYLAISWHAKQRNCLVKLSALCSALKSNGIPISMLLITIIMLMSAFAYLCFGYVWLNHSSYIDSLQQTARWSFGFALNAGNKGSLKKYETLSGTVAFFLYFCILFVTAQLAMKAFLVAAYQQKLRHLKEARHRLSQTPRFSKQGSRDWGSRRSRIDKRNAQADAKDSAAANIEHVSWSSMCRAARDEALAFARVFGSVFFCGYPPGCASLRISEYDYLSYSRPSSTSLESGGGSVPKFLPASLMTKEKLGLERNFSSCGASSGFHDFSAAQSLRENLPSTSPEDEYKLTGDIALAEAEIQVDELCLRATVCIEDAMKSLKGFDFPLEAKQNHGSNIGLRSQSSGYDSESEVIKLSEKLAAFVRQHDYHIDDDADTVISNSTAPPEVESSWAPTLVSALDTPSHHPSNLLVSSCSTDQFDTALPKTSEARMRAAGEAAPPERICDASCSDYDRSPDVMRQQSEHSKPNFRRNDLAQKLQCTHDWTSNKTSETDCIDTLGDTAEQEESEEYFSKSDSSLPGLTAFNLARHNRRLQKHHSMFAETSGFEATSVIPAAVEELPSSEVSLQDFNRSEGNRATSLWKMLVTSKWKQRRTAVKPVKARPLRRSQTVFLDAKKLPAFKFSISSSPTANESSGPLFSSNPPSRPPHFAPAFDQSRPQVANTQSPRQTNDVTRETSPRHNQPDYCEEARNLPGFIPESPLPGDQTIIITKQSARSTSGKKQRPYEKLT